MRLLELRLAAFGPLSDVTLDLSPAQPGLHVIYGGNEAGKSTALRALTGFFFGFPHVTTDTYQHKQLRVGARLLGDDGGELDLVRKKGRKRTLVDRADHAVDEAPLRRLLGGVGPELFTTVFGLDHETLRSGADTLVRGKGHIGESLFEVGLGTAGLSDVLDDLRKQADAIYSPRARTRPLNEALKQCATSRQEVSRESVTAQAYLVQEKGLESAREEATRCEEKHRELTRQLHRLERAKRTLPLLARRQQLLEGREELGEVRRLPEDTSRRREDAHRVIAEATARLEEIEAKRSQLCAQRDAHPALEGPADEDQERERLLATLAAHEQSSARIPTLRGELSRLEADAQAVLRGLGRGDSLDRVEALRIDTPTQARITKLALEAGPVRTRRGAARQAAGDLETRRAELRSRLDALPPEIDVNELSRARAHAVRAGDLEARLREAEDAATLARHVVEDLAEALGIPRAQASSAARLTVVPVDEVSRLAGKHRELTSEQSRIDGLLGPMRERASETSAALEALAGEGDVPSETELESARQARDRAFVALLTSKKALRAEQPEVRSFQQSVATADAVADRLRREADRVARKARLTADQGRLTTTIDGLERALSTLAEAFERHRAELTERWQNVPVSARSADDWLVWLGRHGELVRAERSREGLERSRDAVVTQAEELRAALAAALAAHDADVAAPSLEAKLDAAGALVQRLETESRARQNAEQVLGETEQQLARAAAERREAEAAYEAWREAWQASIAPLGLTDGASPEEATAVLGDLTALFRKLDEGARVSRELEAESKRARDFSDEVRRIARARAPELAGDEDPVVTARTVVSLLSEQSHARSERARLDEALEGLETRTTEQREQLRVGELALRELIHLAGAEDEAGLVAVEVSSQEAHALDEQIASVDEQIASHGEGATVKALVEETSSLSPDDVASQLDDLHSALEELDRRRLGTQRNIGELVAGLGKLGAPNRAVDAAVETEEHLAEAARLVSEYARLRTAVAFLEREIERYREENQDPLLRRAGELLSRLTRGRYRGVQAAQGDDDRAVFHAVRSDGDELDVEALSDGTRDQLYLALRIATLERRVAEAEPMPFVLDDILVHFDDERATAALEVLGELAGRVQILFFTHHTRLRELARIAVPKDRLCEHELPAPIEPGA